jgi:hypothetical protein
MKVMERTRVVALVGLLGLAMTLGACSTKNSSTSATATVGAPVLVSPAGGASIGWANQPITMVVTNVSGVSSAATYTFEVATDAAFTNKVSTKTASAGTNQTSVQADTLAALATYYWRARVQDGSTTGPFANPNAFSVGEKIVIGAPTPLSPANSAATAGWPTLTVANATRSGPTGSIVYKFEVSSSSAFTTIVASGSVPEGSGQTSYTPTLSNAPVAGSTYYWRVTVTDTTYSVSGAASTTRSFVFQNLAVAMALQQGITLWPGVQPPGTPGKTQISGGWDLANLVSFTGVRFTSPTLENMRLLDLLDRGYDPNAAIGWMNTNGYGTAAVYYSSVAAIGFEWNYMANLTANDQVCAPGTAGCAWALVFRVGALKGFPFIK